MAGKLICLWLLPSNSFFSYIFIIIFIITAQEINLVQFPLSFMFVLDWLMFYVVNCLIYLKSGWIKITPGMFWEQAEGKITETEL